MRGKSNWNGCWNSKKEEEDFTQGNLFGQSQSTSA